MGRIFLLVGDAGCRDICVCACMGNRGANHAQSFQRVGLCFTRSLSSINFSAYGGKGKTMSGILSKEIHDFSVNWEKFSKDLILSLFKIIFFSIGSLKSLPSLSIWLTQGKSSIFQLNIAYPSPYSLATNWVQPWRDYTPSMYKDIDSQ